MFTGTKYYGSKIVSTNANVRHLYLMSWVFFHKLNTNLKSSAIFEKYFDSRWNSKWSIEQVFAKCLQCFKRFALKHFFPIEHTHDLIWLETFDMIEKFFFVIQDSFSIIFLCFFFVLFKEFFLPVDCYSDCCYCFRCLLIKFLLLFDKEWQKVFYSVCHKKKISMSIVVVIYSNLSVKWNIK